MSDIVQGLEGFLERLHIYAGLRPILSLVIMLAAVFAVAFAALRGPSARAGSGGTPPPSGSSSRRGSSGSSCSREGRWSTP
ncbi:hypothetical protein ACFQQB_54925 [Nonomuraea rubra]|uniref:hypothetical protein n=1 Tax=Nonomuraea rubra TaxID=46180 RepID=UPI003613258A